MRCTSALPEQPDTWYVQVVDGDIIVSHHELQGVVAADAAAGLDWWSILLVPGRPASLG